MTLTQRQTVIGIGILVLLLLLLVFLLPKAFAGGNGSDGGDNEAGSGGIAPATSAAAQQSGNNAGGSAPSSTAAAGPAPSDAASLSSAAPSSSAAAPSSAPPSSAPASDTFKLPAGWTSYGDKGTGFSVPLPPGMKAQPSDPNELYFKGNNRLLIIAQTDHPAADPMADWKQQEANRSGGTYQNYSRIKMDSVDFFQKAVDWEFTYTTRSGNDQHAVKRNFITGPNQAYSINWYVSPDDWDASQKDLKVIYEGFKPL